MFRLGMGWVWLLPLDRSGQKGTPRMRSGRSRFGIAPQGKGHTWMLSRWRRRSQAGKAKVQLRRWRKMTPRGMLYNQRLMRGWWHLSMIRLGTAAVLLRLTGRSGQWDKAVLRLLRRLGRRSQLGTCLRNQR